MQNNLPGAEPGLRCKEPAAPWMAHGAMRGPARTGSVPVAGWCHVTDEAAPVAVFPWTRGCYDTASCLSYPKSKAFCTASFYSL